MKKPVKRILWGLAIFAGLLIIAAVLFFINFRQATKAMTPAETGAINDSAVDSRNYEVGPAYRYMYSVPLYRCTFTL